MSYAIKLLPQAHQDILQASRWYQSNNTDLKHHFYVQLSESVDYLMSNPKLFEEVYKDIRQVSISRTSFNLFYKVDEAQSFIVILAVIPDAQHEYPENELIG